jgi:hypothetical protein
MLIIYQPENSDMEVRIHDTKDERTFYTDEAELTINLEGVASNLDDFVGLNRKQKSSLTIHTLLDSPVIQQLVTAFVNC